MGEYWREKHRKGDGLKYRQDMCGLIPTNHLRTFNSKSEQSHCGSEPFSLSSLDRGPEHFIHTVCRCPLQRVLEHPN